MGLPIMLMRKVVKDWFTEPDGESFCLIKAIAGTGALVFFGCSITHVILSHQFDYMNFGIGLGSIMAGAGGGLYLKKDTQDVISH